MTGVWFETDSDAAAHQAAMRCLPDGRYQALAVGRLASGRLSDPDIALFYATPGSNDLLHQWAKVVRLQIV